jgi:hypothetical protein
MGSAIEINDTLKLPLADLPADLAPGVFFEFRRPGRRLFQLAPTRCFLVADVGGAWDMIGEIKIVKLQIDTRDESTSGLAVVSKLYSDATRAFANEHLAPPGKGLAPATR